MGTKSMKGIMKGIRNIFDGKESQEMQIGFPTDVKHVAHIGWDGPAVNNSPSWMGDYQALNSGPLNGNGNGSIGGSHELSTPNWSSQEMDNGENGSKDLPAVPLPTSPKASRRNASSDKEGGSSTGPKQSRRHHHSGSSDSPARESSEGSRRARRERRVSGGSGDSDSSTSSALQEGAPGIPKTRRRKAKEAKGSKEGSTTSRTKAAASEKGSEQLQVSPLKPNKEEKEGDQ